MSEIDNSQIEQTSETTPAAEAEVSIQDPVLRQAMETAIRMGVAPDDAAKRAAALSGETPQSKPVEVKAPPAAPAVVDEAEQLRQTLQQKEEHYKRLVAERAAAAMQDQQAAAAEKKRYLDLMQKLREKPTEWAKENNIDVGKMVEEMAIEGTPEARARREMEALRAELDQLKAKDAAASQSQIQQDFISRVRTMDPKASADERLNTNHFVASAFDSIPDDVLLHEGYSEAHALAARTGRDPSRITNAEIVQSLNAKYARLFANFLRKNEAEFSAGSPPPSPELPRKKNPEISEVKTLPTSGPENLAKMTLSERLEYLRRLEQAGKI